MTEPKSTVVTAKVYTQVTVGRSLGFCVRPMGTQALTHTGKRLRFQRKRAGKKLLGLACEILKGREEARLL